jgi:rubrerythrin
MSIKINWAEWWRRWFDASEKRYRALVNILRQRYVDEKQHAARLNQHAEKMRYPQFREALRRIAADESKHADWIAKKIQALGGMLPPVTEVRSQQKNSWQCLLEDLEEERRCSADLEDDMLAIRSDYPDVDELLGRIDEEERKHCDEIREMLMRSDPQASFSG